MTQITPHLGDYKPGRLQITDDLWADPPQLMETVGSNLDPDCEHDFVDPTITVTYDFYGEGWHRVVWQEWCRRCDGTSSKTWKTAVVYKGLKEYYSRCPQCRHPLTVRRFTEDLEQVCPDCGHVFDEDEAIRPED